MKDGRWIQYTFPQAKDREVTLEVRKCVFDLCWHSGRLCQVASALPNEAGGLSDTSKQKLIALVSEMYETLATCSELLDLEIVSGVKEKMRMNSKKYDAKECRVSDRILMQNMLLERTHILSLFYVESKRNY